MKLSLFSILWHDGAYSVGDVCAIVKAYCKKMNTHIGLLKLKGCNKIVYSLKVNGNWIPKGTINDTGNFTNNRRAAYRAFFRTYLLRNQIGFSIIKLR